MVLRGRKKASTLSDSASQKTPSDNPKKAPADNSKKTPADNSGPSESQGTGTQIDNPEMSELQETGTQPDRSGSSEPQGAGTQSDNSEAKEKTATENKSIESGSDETVSTISEGENQVVVVDARTQKFDEPLNVTSSESDLQNQKGATEERQRIYRRIGDYEIEIIGDRLSADFRIVRENDVIAEAEGVTATVIEIAGKSKKLNALEVAEQSALATYHKTVNTVDGLVDISAIAEHPLNSLIYGENESVEDLVKLLQEDDGQVFKIIINSQGQILSGNRRFKAAQIVNDKFLEKGLPPKFEFLSAEVLGFESPESELKYMLLQNQSRTKTPKQLASEIQTLIALNASSALPNERKSSSKLIDELSTRLGGGSGKAGRSTAFNLQAAYNKIDGFKDEQLKDDLRVYAVTMPNKAKDLVTLECPPEVGLDQETYQKIVLERLKEKPSESVERAASAVNRKIIAEKHTSKNGKEVENTSTSTKENNGKKTETSSSSTPTDAEKILEAIKVAIAAGDKPSDNRRTPPEIVKLCFDVMGRVDLDAFAELSNPDRIGASKSYTILDDAFSQILEGNVFANPPYSKSSESLTLMDKEICNGHIKKLFLILPVSVESSRPYHQFVRSHNPLIFQPNKRLGFDPGDLLKHVEPNAKADGNREPSLILYWDAYQDYQTFSDHAHNMGFVLQAYKPFNPVSIALALSSLIWEKVSPKVVACNVFGSTVEIEQDIDDTYRIKISGVLLPNPCPSLAIAKAFATVTAVNKLAPDLPVNF